ncbi:hypothetical protein V6N12_071952 [Hibiscus sabdariffa]|uniref:Uncharacterized protein n=1 Tax=Hibiscus sabdariffa TaxID=183260 RepID=A0ABR2FLA6_9ROSI
MTNSRDVYHYFQPQKLQFQVRPVVLAVAVSEVRPVVLAVDCIFYTKSKMSSMKLHVVAAMGLLFMAVALLPFGYGQSLDLSPAPAPSSDGTAIDQGIAYILLLLALAVTYLIH